MNFDAELLKVLGRPELLLLPKVMEELELLNANRPRAKQLLLSMLIAKSSTIEPPLEVGEHTDDQLLHLAQTNSMVVLTVDVELKRRLFERAVPVLEVSKKKRLNLIEGL
jgi:rRNA-processing protein FCF1